MSFTRRMALLTTGAVAVAVVCAALAARFAVSHDLHRSLDQQLQHFGRALAKVARFADPRDITLPPQAPAAGIGPGRLGIGDPAVLSASGHLFRQAGDQTPFRVSADEIAVARGRAPAHFRDETLSGQPIRVFVAPAQPGDAVIVEASTADLRHSLHALDGTLLIIVGAGILAAGALAILVVRYGTRPVHELRTAAERVTETGDLQQRIEVNGRDDLGRLAHAFEQMLVSLHASQRAQQQLVGDASHELRTPVAALRTNLEVLGRANGALTADERAQMLHELISQAIDLSTLIDDLLDAAGDGDGDDDNAPHRLDHIVNDEIDRIAIVYDRIHFDVALEPTLIHGSEPRLRRAIANLIENAAKYGGPDDPVTITLHDGRLQVRDHGPGFRDEDLPHVFERFYRSPAARATPGTGLGLSIVERVAHDHGGQVHAANAPDGGAVMTLTLPRISEQS